MAENNSGATIPERRSEIERIVESIISDVLGRELGVVRADAELEAELGIDSIHRSEISIKISHIYPIPADSEELETADTFGELVDAVSVVDANRSQEDGS